MSKLSNEQDWCLFLKYQVRKYSCSFNQKPDTIASRHVCPWFPRRENVAFKRKTNFVNRIKLPREEHFRYFSEHDFKKLTEEIDFDFKNLTEEIDFCYCARQKIGLSSLRWRRWCLFRFVLLLKQHIVWVCYPFEGCFGSCVTTICRVAWSAGFCLYLPEVFFPCSLRRGTRESSHVAFSSIYRHPPTPSRSQIAITASPPWSWRHLAGQVRVDNLLTKSTRKDLQHRPIHTSPSDNEGHCRFLSEACLDNRGVRNGRQWWGSTFRATRE